MEQYIVEFQRCRHPTISPPDTPLHAPKSDLLKHSVKALGNVITRITTVNFCHLNFPFLFFFFFVNLGNNGYCIVLRCQNLTNLSAVNIKITFLIIMWEVVFKNRSV